MRTKPSPVRRWARPWDLVNEDEGEILTYDLDDDSNFTNENTPGIHDFTVGEETYPADYSFFSIDRATGQIMVKKKLSAEATDDRRYTGDGATSTPGKYVFWVRATDPSNEHAPRVIPRASTRAATRSR